MKSRALLIVILMGLLSSTQLRADLVAHWNFEEGSGATTLDQVNQNNDPLTDTTWVADAAPIGGGNFCIGV